MPNDLRAEVGAKIADIFARKEGESAADAKLRDARHRAEAHAARLLAARECPPDIIEWGRAHGFPTFAEFTWMAGFQAGMHIAMLSAYPDPLEAGDGE